MARKLTVLHYTGADDDRGGVIAVIRALASAGRFDCVLGINPDFRPRRPVPFATHAFSAVAGETLGLSTLWRARTIALEVRAWLNGGPARVFHGHSRAGLAVALWLHRMAEPRAVATIHHYGRQRWFYRWAARQLGARLFWLTPAMKRYYGLGDGWEQCLTGCLPAEMLARPIPKRAHTHGPIRFGGAGLIVPWKGWHLILEALAMLPPAVRAQTHFVHIGSAANSPEAQTYAVSLRQRTIDLGLAELVEWRGEQASSAGLLAEVNCAVVVSDHEPFSMVMLEALAAGVPVLASAAGGPADVLEAGVNGWLFEPGNAQSLADAMAKLVTTDALARVRITPEQLAPYRADTIAARWAEIYSAVSA